MHKKTKAFTLIEIIMAIILLAIIAATIGIFITQQMQSVVWSKQYTEALNLARLDMEVANNTPFASLAVGTTTNNTYDSAFNVVRIISTPYSYLTNSLKLIEVHVRLVGSGTDLVALYNYKVDTVTIGS
ncbi:MAG: prepilin-type N-terminal cleavage/methylation domain-containing protein [Candidatus Omnitrophica bacterium]|nr:prepilin-type N-terminal cleavage/methylation domain-containing protein [Candidatus Omnitrophota bacterium]